ncbi:MAG: DUF58 domain-containing protein [Myxococcales bacterium]|nr:DUF58 domain-containing protein [Myxococcales bacterium]
MNAAVDSTEPAADAVKAARTSRERGPPQLTAAGRGLLGGAVAVTFVGATTGQALLVAAGMLLLALLTAGWLGTRAALRAIGALDVWVAAPEGTSRARGSALPVRLRMVYRGRRPLRDLDVALRLVGDPAPAPRATLDVPPGAEGRLDFALVFPRAGHWRIHGVELTVVGPLGLARAARYRPAELALNVRPRRRPAVEVAALLARRGAARDRVGRHIAGRAGGGLELRELREYVPGDPLKTVAWKATARRRRPLVRAFEEETVRRVQVLLDIGPTMRAGPLGQTPLDRAIELCATLCEEGVHDRIGLTTFDHRVYGHLRPAGGREHLQRALHHLMDLTRVVDDDLTEIADAELLARVGAFLEAQDGLPLRRTGADPWQPRVARTLVDPLAELYDVGALYAAVNAYLAAERDRGHQALFAKGRPARETLPARLRLFCALRGLPIPYRLAGPLDAFERGLVDALGQALRPGGADRLVLVSDLRGLDPEGAAARSLRLARARKKELVVVAVGPEPPSEAQARALRAAHAQWQHRPPREGDGRSGAVES